MAQTKADRQSILSLTKKDFRFDFFSGTGGGGQHRNRHKNSVRCFHDPSGAMGTSQDERSKEQNLKRAWRRCIESKKFKKWLRIETARAMGSFSHLEDDGINPNDLKVEVKENGLWKEVRSI